MSDPESVQQPCRRLRWLLVVIGLCLLLPLDAAEPPTKEMSPTEQQAKVMEFKHLLAETQKLRAAGKLSEAIADTEKALTIVRQLIGNNNDNVVKLLDLLAELYEQRGDSTAAGKQLREVRDIQTARFGKDDWRVTDARLALADLELRAKLDGEQRKQLAEADQFNRQLLALYRKGRSREAVPQAQRALALRKQVLGEKHPSYATSLNNLARLYDSMGDYAKAEPLYRQALDITRQSLQQTASVQSERQQLRMGDNLRFRLDSYLSAVVQAQAKNERPGDSTPALYGYILAWKGAVFMQQHRQRLARRHPELSPLFEKLQDVSRRLATRALAVPAPQQRLAWRKDIADLTEQRENLESELASRCTAFDRDQRLARLTAKDLQAVLPADAVLLDFLEFSHSRPDPKKKGKWLSERHLAAFVVRHGRPLVLKDLGAVEDIAEAIQSWRRIIAQKGDGHGGDDPARTLRRLLWQPLAEAVGDAAVVLVSPDGVLGTFPFAALPGDKDDHYLIEERGVAVVAVPQLLPELLRAEAKDHKDTPSSLLLFGDVDFDAGAGQSLLADASRSAARGLRQGAVGQFRPLAATRGEVLAVRDSFEQRFADAKVKALRQAAATEAAFRRQAPSYRYLHLATHGFFAPAELKSALAPADPKKMALLQSTGGDPFGRLGMSGYHPGLLSGLALAGANREPKAGEDDGILTALEVAALDLSGVESVVLSACETGLGQAAGGEGLLGLQRAFQVSGAHTVVASLWTVDDEWTRKLMERYYENLWQKKMPKLAALREAQRRVMRQAPKRGGLERPDSTPPLRVAPPFYWAAFVLSGDWR